MIQNISLRFGRSPEAVPLSFKPAHMTVYVGPNNSGKTLILREIHAAFGDDRWPHLHPNYIPNEKRMIIKDVRLDSVPEAALSSFVGAIKGNSGWDLVSGANYNIPFDPATTADLVMRARSDAQVSGMLRTIFYRTKICLLDGMGRLSLTVGRPVGPLTGPPQNHLQALFVDDARRSKLKEATNEAFGFYVMIDPTQPGQFRFCTSESLPSRPEIERSLSAEALAYFSQAKSIDGASDGVKAYTGIIAAVLSTEFQAILIDEPEAFLHPPLARKLGVFLAEIARDRGATVFVATHSADFLSGCVQSGAPVDVVRLTYDRSVASARMLSNQELTPLMRDPLLRSTGVLSALFYRGAVVCEADTDRAFYAEVNERLLRLSHGGIVDSVFLNAQNWQTCSNIIGPLRDMGIPAAAIVDLDVLLSADFTKLLGAAYVPAITATSMTQTRANLKAAFQRAAGPGAEPKEVARMVKRDGLGCLSGGERQACVDLLNQLSGYGLFLVPVGEIERWLIALGADGHGAGWLRPIFEAMGDDPHSAGYVLPGEGDVWEFLRGVAKWISEPLRLGIPS